jgi:hypothetical protein
MQAKKNEDDAMPRKMFNTYSSHLYHPGTNNDSKALPGPRGRY